MDIPLQVDVAAIRRRTGLSQARFAASIGVSFSTYENWERGRRAPEGSARVLLAMLERNPRVVVETLGHGTFAEVPAPQARHRTRLPASM